MTYAHRRAFTHALRRLTTGLALAATGLLGSAPAWADNAVVRIGYQKYGTLTVLKGKGDLEKRLAPLGVDVRWTEFPAGPQLLEGLNVGSIDFGTVGEAPPIFAQAAGADLVYVANQPPAPTAEAILLPKGSPIKSVAELKGKKIALNKGSNVHYLLVKALEKAGLKYTDIQPVFLPPADARAAFERGSVDAWVIWDPFQAAAEKQIGARVLVDGRGIVSNHQFYLASRPYAAKNPGVIKAIVSELQKVDVWIGQNAKAAAEVLAPQIGLNLDITELAVRRFTLGIQPINLTVAAEQQKIADTFHALKLIPKPISIKDALPEGIAK
jgi:sulfonate transport system substrate-binding protein